MSSHSHNIPGILFLLAVAMLGSSCHMTHYYYMPDPQNVPLFRQKREARLEASTGSSGALLGVRHLEAAYAATDHLGVVADASFFHAKDDVLYTQYEECNSQLLQVGAGCYGKFSEQMLWETYAGYGAGSDRNKYAEGGSTDIRFRRYFLQPAIGFSSRWFEAALSTRLCALQYDQQNTTGKLAPNDVEDLGALARPGTHWLAEPAITLRFGWRSCKFQIQSVWSKALNGDLPMTNNTVIMGLQFNSNSAFKPE